MRDCFRRLTVSRERLPRDRRGPLRVAFLVTSLPVGGAETLLVNLLKRLDTGRVVGEVICMKERGPLGETLAESFPVHDQLLNGKYDVGVIMRLRQLLRDRQIDAVVTVGAGDKMFWGRLAAWVAGVPVIASALHSTGWPDGVGRVNRWLTPLTDAFIAVAAEHGQFMREFERFPANRISVIRNGIDTDRFRPRDESSNRSDLRKSLGVPAKTPLVGLVAALRPEKNHRRFIDVAAKVRRNVPEAHFVLIGDGPERPAIEARLQSQRLEKHVHLLGTRHDTDRLVAELDVFLLTSDNEANPVSILEALACGVPVVSSDVGSIAETVQPGNTGYLFSPDDEAAAARYVSQLLVDHPQRQRLGMAGRQRVLASGSLDTMVAGYQELFERLYDQGVVSPALPVAAEKVVGAFARESGRG